MSRRIAFIALLAGCAAQSGARVETSVVSATTHELRVCGDVRAFHAGAAVRFLRRQCRPLSPKLVALRCDDEEVARGEVVRAVDDACVLVRVAADRDVHPDDRPELVNP